MLPELELLLLELEEELLLDELLLELEEELLLDELLLSEALVPELFEALLVAVALLDVSELLVPVLLEDELMLSVEPEELEWEPVDPDELWLPSPELLVAAVVLELALLEWPEELDAVV